LGLSSAGTNVVDWHLSGMQQKLRPSGKIPPRKRRWRMRQADEDELDETLFGLGTEKDGSSGN
jgi:hypothetical protein